MQYEGDVYRPPSEARSLIIQVTIGCSHNTCTFCHMYTGKQFRIRKREEILGTFPELSSEYQIRISHLDGKDSMRIYVEAGGNHDFKSLQQKVAAAVKSKIGFTPIVYVVELGFLPRSEKKSKRVIDERFQ